MSLFGSALIGFLLAVAILVTVHEFGHYLAARWLGVRVLRFSVGFGPVLLRWRGKRSIFKGDEFAVSAIPLGGYVRMLDTRDTDVGVLAPDEQREAFDRQLLWKRSVIVAAGPFANFLLAIVLYAVALAWPERALAPIVAAPRMETAASIAGLRGGEVIKEISGREIYNWDDVRWQLLAHMFDDRLTMVVRDQGRDREVVLERAPRAVGEDPTGRRLLGWGIGIYQPAVLGSVVADGPGERAGLKAGDRIVSIDERKIDEWFELTQVIQASPNREVRLGVERAGLIQTVIATPRAVRSGNREIGRLEVTPPNLFEEGSNALATERRGFASAFTEGAARSWEATALTVRVLWGMVTGEVSLRQVSGPLSMAEGAGVTLKQGVTAFLFFLAIVSISIGVLNLLPIPMLDGGQLLYHLFEAIKGSPPSERALIIGQRIGIGFVTSLTALALYNDFHRIFS